MSSPLVGIEGQYEILHKISEGGMGAVYKVRHRILDEVRVIKIVRPQLAEVEDLKARFLREARVAVRLRHPYIAQLYDCNFDAAGNAFSVIEFIEGKTLEEILKGRGCQSLGLTLELSRQCLEVLGFLHEQGVIHRDISPDNIMLTRSGARPVIKLIDLGIAKVLESQTKLTATGTFVGKLRYAAPESFKFEEGVQLDARSDLYSFSVVLYELLTGHLPIKGATTPALIAGHLYHPPMDFAESDPEQRVPELLQGIVMKGLAKQSDERFQSAAEFITALEQVRKDHPYSIAEISAIFGAEAEEEGTRRLAAAEVEGDLAASPLAPTHLTPAPAVEGGQAPAASAEPTHVTPAPEPPPPPAPAPPAPTPRAAAPPPAPVAAQPPPVSGPQLAPEARSVAAAPAPQPKRRTHLLAVVGGVVVFGIVVTIAVVVTVIVMGRRPSGPAGAQATPAPQVASADVDPTPQDAVHRPANEAPVTPQRPAGQTSPAAHGRPTAPPPTEAPRPRRPGSLGAMARNPDEATRTELGRGGARVTYVEPGGAAAAAGLAYGDVIVAVDGASIANTDELSAILGRHCAGDHLRFEVVRAGATVTLTVVLAAR